MNELDLIVVGGGAAGFFTAINAKLNSPTLTVTILEQSKEVLNKVRISGGGRCNVTHACFDASQLCLYYPRGQKELKGPFHVFGCKDTMDWFENQGVKLIVQPDGCVFPLSNTSESIISCFMKLARQLDIEILKNSKVKEFNYTNGNKFPFEIMTESTTFSAKKMMLATGSSPFMWNLLSQKGYEIIKPVPSLFTFNLPSHPITKLMGLVVPNAAVYIKDTKIVTQGPILITHWGLSGPAILKASAWGAKILDEKQYQFTALVDWIPSIQQDEITQLKVALAKKKVLANQQFGLPARLWQFLLDNVIIDKEKNWASLTKLEMKAIIQQLKACPFDVKGKTTFKEEFVTAGGVTLGQMNFKTFESKLHPGLFIAGEVLNIDAVTGGFNFQAAWTGGYLAAKAITS